MEQETILSSIEIQLGQINKTLQEALNILEKTHKILTEQNKGRIIINNK